MAMKMTAAEISEGSWSARWGNHLIHLRERDGWWHAIVWAWPHGRERRTLLDEFDGFVNAQVAVAWACDVLVAHGASILVLSSEGGPPVTTKDLPRLLKFNPAPEIVP